MDKDKVLELIGSMSVLEACQLIKDMEEKFGISEDDLEPIVVEQAVEEVVVEEPTEISVILTSYGEKKVGVVKIIRAHTGLDLKQSMALANDAPSQIGDVMSPDQAEELKRLLEDAGGTVELK